jgi:hypothetical protein
MSETIVSVAIDWEHRIGPEGARRFADFGSFRDDELSASAAVTDM